MNPFLERLRNGPALVSDGAMGTLLQSRAELEGGECFEALTLTDPDLVRSVHQDYLDAGAEVIETNTFAANSHRLGLHGRTDVEAINRAAVALAREVVAGTDAFVVGAVGPLGTGVKPFGRLRPAEAHDAFLTQITALAGVDVIALQTFSDHGEVTQAIAAARDADPDRPIIAQMTFERDDRTTLGFMPGRAADLLVQAGADVIGVNCSGGPTQARRVLEAMRRSSPHALFAVHPNAGFPAQVGGRMVYRTTADYFAEYATILRDLGASLIGGCCGTTPAHIQAMRTALDVAPSPISQIIVTEPAAKTTTPSQPAGQSTELASRLAEGAFTVSVEMSPPRSPDTETLLASGAMLRDAGAHLLNVADSPAARMRMSPWAVAQVLQMQVGLETILSFPTRGRNLLRIQGDLLAAHALGLRNVFVTMGDPTRIGDYPAAMDSFDIAPSALMQTIVQSMNAGSDHAGNALGQATSFTVGCALNMFAGDLDREFTVLERKLDAGVDFALAQPVFEPAGIQRFLLAFEARFDRPFDLPVLMGIMPLFGVRQARFLDNEIPGITIPPSIMRRLEDAGEDAPAEGVRIAVELLHAVRDTVQGIYVIPPLGKYDLAAEVVGAV